MGFAKIDNIDEILADTNDFLKTLLLNHVVDGRVLSGDLKDGQVVEALGGANRGGGNLNVKIDDKGVKINNAKVINADNFASNGVIHVIDTVLTFGEGKVDESTDPVESKASFLMCAAVSTFSGLVGVVAFM